MPFPKKSQNSATSENIITDPLSPDSTTLMNGHDACTISFYLMGEKKPNFPIVWAKKRENSKTEIDDGFIIETQCFTWHCIETVRIRNL